MLYVGGDKSVLLMRSPSANECIYREMPILECIGIFCLPMDMSRAGKQKPLLLTGIAKWSNMDKSVAAISAIAGEYCSEEF